MTAPFATIAGHPVSTVTVHVPPVGVWFADVELEGAPDVSGRVTLALGELELVGTVDPQHGGTHGLRRRLRLVGGAGGWATLLRARHYHNDSRIRARTIAEDAAREAGESLGDFAPAAERVGIDYVRRAGPAARALEDVIGTASWWVAYDGTTVVGTRQSTEAAPGSYEVLEHAPDERLVTLAVDDLTAVGIGSVLSQRLDEPQTVRELEIRVTPESVRVLAWCGGEDGSRGRLAGALAALVESAQPRRIYGVSRYRVVRMSSDRVELQAVRRGVGLPDISPVSMWPGAAGLHAELAPGAECLVQFIDGDPTQPVVTHFAGKDGHGWTPANVVLSASTTLRLGGTGASEGVPLGNALKTWADGHVHGYLGDSGAPAVTTVPITPPYDGVTGTPDPSPDPSSKVLVE